MSTARRLYSATLRRTCPRAHLVAAVTSRRSIGSSSRVAGHNGNNNDDDGDAAADGDDGDADGDDSDTSSSNNNNSSSSSAPSVLPTFAQQATDLFYSSSTRRCLLCDEDMTMTYRLHSLTLEHTARLAVYEAAVQHISAQQRYIEASLLPRHRQHHQQQQQQQQQAQDAHDRAAATMTRTHHGALWKGLPSLRELRQRPSLLQQFNFTDALTQSWWCKLNTGDEATTLVTSAVKRGGGKSSSSSSSSWKGNNSAAATRAMRSSQTVFDFDRILSLTSPRAHVRRARVRHLLYFLRQRHILRHCFAHSSASALPSSAAVVASSSPASRGGGGGVSLSGGISATSGGKTRPYSRADDEDTTFARSVYFERCEMVGDNLMKAAIYDRIMCVFATTSSSSSVFGSIDDRLYLLQQLLDSNAGLRAIYDYLQLGRVLGLRLSHSKTKSDVVEAIVGELQLYLWACEVRGGCSRHDAVLTEPYPAVPTRTAQYLRALVAHTLNELVHTVFMWRLESTLANAHHVLQQRVPVDALLRRVKAARSPSSRRAAAAAAGHINKPSSGSGSSEDEDDGNDAAVLVAAAVRGTQRYVVWPLLLSDMHKRPRVVRLTRRGEVARGGARDAYYYSAHIAPTRAPAHAAEVSPTLQRDVSADVQEQQQQLLQQSAQVWRAQFAANCHALHVVRRRGAYVRDYKAALHAQVCAEDDNDDIGNSIGADDVVCDDDAVTVMHIDAARRAVQPLCMTSSQVHELLQRRLANLPLTLQRPQHDDGSNDATRNDKDDAHSVASALHATPTPRPARISRLARRQVLVQCVCVALGAAPS